MINLHVCIFTNDNGSCSIIAPKAVNLLLEWKRKGGFEVYTCYMVVQHLANTSINWA